VRVLLDTNVIIDLLLDREPFSLAAGRLVAQVARAKLDGVLCATTVTTIHYLAARVLGAERAVAEIQKLLSLFNVAAVNRAVLEGALRARFEDFEDGVLHEAAVRCGAQAIVTRDLRHLKRSTIPVYSPDQLLAVLRERDRNRP
jgi:predicted nucleic acid-binding protein